MVRKDRGWAKDAETSWQRFLNWGKGSARSIAAEIKAALLHSSVDIAPGTEAPWGFMKRFHIGR